MHWKSRLFTLGTALIGFGVLAAYWTAATEPAPEEPVAEEAEAPSPITTPFVTVVDPSKGPKDAEVTIVEFGDHACPYCKSTQDAVDRLLAAHPSRVRFVWKSAPSPLHAGADVAAAAALCAHRQGKFWEYHELLFENPSMFDQASMVILASDLRLDGAAFGECLASGATRPLVERTVLEARALGLTGVPTVFVNGMRYEGAMNYEQLLAAAGL